MPEKTERQRGTTIRHAIQRLTVTELLALADDLAAARDPLNACSGRDATIAPALRAFYDAGQLALMAAFGVAPGNGQGKPATKRTERPGKVGSGVTFTPSARDERWLTNAVPVTTETVETER